MLELADLHTLLAISPSPVDQVSLCTEGRAQGQGLFGGRQTAAFRKTPPKRTEKMPHLPPKIPPAGCLGFGGFLVGLS